MEDSHLNLPSRIHLGWFEMEQLKHETSVVNIAYDKDLVLTNERNFEWGLDF